MSRFFVTGDTHRDMDWYKINTGNFPVQKELTKEDYLIIAGDFGCVWFGDRTDDYYLKEYSKRNFTTLFIDGNHENHDLLDSYPVEIWNGGKVHRLTDSVIHLMRGQVYEIDGKTFFTMGGAQSTDMYHRKEGKSWWPREMPSDEEYEEALKNLEAHGFMVDYIITHCCPEDMIGIQDVFFGRARNRLTYFLTSLITEFHVDYKAWYWGHYHYDKDFADMYSLYRRIIELL